MIADPYKDFERWNAEQEEAIAKLPECDECREPIQDDYKWLIEGNTLCEECAKKLYRRFI